MQVRKSIPTALEFRYNAVIKLSMLRSVSVKIKACCRQQLAEPVGTQRNAFALHTQERRRRQTASHARMSTSMSQLTCDFEDIRRGLVVLQTVCRNKLQPSASMQGQLQVQPASVRRNLCFVDKSSAGHNFVVQCLSQIIVAGVSVGPSAVDLGLLIVWSYSLELERAFHLD